MLLFNKTTKKHLVKCSDEISQCVWCIKSFYADPTKPTEKLQTKNIQKEKLDCTICMHRIISHSTLKLILRNSYKIQNSYINISVDVIMKWSDWIKCVIIIYICQIFIYTCAGWAAWFIQDEVSRRRRRRRYWIMIDVAFNWSCC